MNTPPPCTAQSQRLALRDADVHLYPEFFPKPACDDLLDQLLRTTTWTQDTITLFGKTIDVPRLTAWHGDQGKSYRYSGNTYHPMPWSPAMLEVKRAIEPVCGVVFNSVLLNYYRNERDSVGWHSDDEPELGVDPVIASASFGATRAFQLRHKKDRKQKLTVELSSGSLLVMRGPTQHHWLHQVPKSAATKGGRINLTFRVILG